MAGKRRRQRYDTVALISRMRSERRIGPLLALLGITIVGYGAYYFWYEGHELPWVAKEAAPVVAPVTPVVEKKPEPPPPKVEEPEQPAAIVIQLVRAGPLWLNEKLIGPKVKLHEVSLPAGAHVLRTKLGKKMVTESVAVEAGKKYRVSLDAKTKRWVSVVENEAAK